MGIAFGVVLALQIVFSLLNFIFVGISICNDGAFATATNISSLAVLVISAFTLISGIIFFLARTKTNTGRIATQNEG